MYTTSSITQKVRAILKGRQKKSKKTEKLIFKTEFLTPKKKPSKPQTW